MEILSKDNLIDTLEFMRKIAEGSPAKSFFHVTGDAINVFCTKDELITRICEMLDAVESGDKEAYFSTSFEFIQVDLKFLKTGKGGDVVQIDKEFQERAHKMGLERALKLQKEADERVQKDSKGLI